MSINIRCDRNGECDELDLERSIVVVSPASQTYTSTPPPDTSVPPLLRDRPTPAPSPSSRPHCIERSYNSKCCEVRKRDAPLFSHRPALSASRDRITPTSAICDGPLFPDRRSRRRPRDVDCGVPQSRVRARCAVDGGVRSLTYVMFSCNASLPRGPSPSTQATHARVRQRHLFRK
jgi:hypothetical protein